MRDDELIGDERLVETDEQEFELDPLDSEELETAMREALEAVESSAVQSRAADEDDAGAAFSPADTIAQEDAEVAQLQAEITDLRDRSVRTLADFDNYRKRIERERHEESRYVAFDVLREFLSVIDNLERALESEGSGDDLKTGVDLIVRQMQDLLRAHGVARLEADEPLVATSETDCGEPVRGSLFRGLHEAGAEHWGPGHRDDVAEGDSEDDRPREADEHELCNSA